MAITPLDIKNQTFKKVLRGYDTEEISAYLEMLANEMEKLLSEKKVLAEQNRKLESEISEYKNLDRDLRNALLEVQESSRKKLEDAEEEKNRILEEARLQADDIVEGAREQSMKLDQDLESLQGEKTVLINNIRQLLDDQVEAIQAMKANLEGYAIEEESAATGEVDESNVEIDKIQSSQESETGDDESPSEEEVDDPGEMAFDGEPEIEAQESPEEEIEDEGPEVKVEKESERSQTEDEMEGIEIEKTSTVSGIDEESSENMKEEAEEKLDLIAPEDMLGTGEIPLEEIGDELAEEAPKEMEELESGDAGESIEEEEISKKIDAFFDNFEKRTIKKGETLEENSSGDLKIYD